MKQHPNSIYYTLKTLINGDEKKLAEKKLAVSYVYALLCYTPSLNQPRNVLSDEGQRVYTSLSKIGPITLDLETVKLNPDDSTFVNKINNELDKKGRQLRKGGVEEIVLNMLNNLEFRDSINKIGYSLGVLLKEKPTFDTKNAGKIWMYEQKAIKKKLSQYFKK